MSSQAIEEKLKKPDCSVDELLDEDELIQEMKNQNSKLLTYFNKDNVKKLVEYIIEEPTEDDQKKGHRYPFMANEILNCDVSKINEFFTTTDSEFYFRERKQSGISNTDSDLMLSDEHLNINSNVNINEEKKHEESKEKEDDEQKLQQDEKEAIANSIEKDTFGATEETKSLNDMITENNAEIENLQKNKIDLLDYLLSFIDTDKELNYVLAGYFSKFLLHLLNKHPHKIISYVYQEKEYILERLIQHSDKKSISELVAKFLLVENYSAELKSVIDVDAIRRRLLVKLFFQDQYRERY